MECAGRSVSGEIVVFSIMLPCLMILLAPIHEFLIQVFGMILTPESMVHSPRT